MTTSTNNRERDALIAEQMRPEPGRSVPALDRLAMRLGLTLLLWGRHRAETARAPRSALALRSTPGSETARPFS